MDMGMKLKLPIICRVDNIGAIFMAENITTSSRAKHLDLRARYVTEFIDDGFIKIIFVKTAENLSDWFTKNVSSQIYDEHKKRFIKEREEVPDSTTFDGIEMFSTPRNRATTVD
jgi:hypothetical protein